MRKKKKKTSSQWRKNMARRICGLILQKADELGMAPDQQYGVLDTAAHYVVTYDPELAEFLMQQANTRRYNAARTAPKPSNRIVKDDHVDMSRMMRYLLYESDKHCVSLNSAIIFLKKYLNLMKLRYMDTVNINLDVPSSCSEDVALVPLVFIPFVENAFKHGVGIGKPSTIDISIEHKDSRLLFHCRNTKSHAKHEYGGVGLSNVTKRLELIYGSDYSLDINDEDDSYDVRLDLPAKCPEDFKPRTISDKTND